MNHVLWTTPQLPKVEFLKGQYLGVAYRPHFHSDYGIGVVEQGTHVFHYRKNKHMVPTNHVMTLQPGETRTGCQKISTTCHYRTIFMHPSIMQQAAKEMGYKSTNLPVLNRTIIADAQVVRAVRSIHYHAETKDSTLSQEVLLQDLLHMLLSKFMEAQLTPAKIHNEQTPIARVKSYINEYYSEDIQLDDLIKVAYLSKSYFIRAFRHHMGISPHAYLVQVRLNHAKYLLQEGYLPVDVAQRVGFHDQSHFTRYFKLFLSLTPGQYQRAIG